MNYCGAPLVVLLSSFFVFVTILLLFFNLLYIARKPATRIASFGIFALNIECNFKYKKFSRRQSDIFLLQYTVRINRKIGVSLKILV